MANVRDFFDGFKDQLNAWKLHLLCDNGKLNTKKATHYGILLSTALYCVLFLLISALAGYSAFLNGVACFFVIVISCYLCVLYRYNLPMFIVMLMIAYCNYSIVVGVYWDPSIRPQSLYEQFSGEQPFGIAIFDMLVFVTVLLAFAGKYVGNEGRLNSKPGKGRTPRRYDPVIAYGGIALYLLIFFACFRLGEDGTRGSSSAINEYRALILITGSFYCGNKRVYKWLWTAAVGITSVLVFFSGNRIDAFASVFALIIIWHANIVNYKLIVAVLPVGLVGMTLVGTLRGGGITGAALLNSFKSVFDGKLTFNTPIWAYVPTLCITRLTETVPFMDRMKLLLEHIVYILKPWAASATSPDLAAYSRQYYAHAYGFISTGYFRFWFGPFGAVLFAGLVQMYASFGLKFVHRKARKFLDYLQIVLFWYFAANVSRWYIYGPLSLLRGMLICAVCFAVVFAGDHIIGGLRPIVELKYQQLKAQRNKKE